MQRRKVTEGVWRRVINSVWELQVFKMEGMRLEKGVQVKALAQVRETCLQAMGGSVVWRKASGCTGERFHRWNREIQG